MAQIVCFEVYPSYGPKFNIDKMRDILVYGHHFVEKSTSPKRVYFYKEVSSLDAFNLKAILTVYRYKFKSYDKRYGRDSYYRQRYFKNNKGPYHCAYCGRKLKPNQIEVDHLVPVAKAKSKIEVRTLLHIFGITNVNDVRNLVSACHKCNMKKLDKMGFWVIRGAFGRYKAFWTILRTITVAFILFGVGFIFLQPTVVNFFQNLFA